MSDLGTPKPDDDGYVVVPPINRSQSPIKGVKCGECGMKFDYNVGYGYVCMHQNCPMQTRATFGNY